MFLGYPDNFETVWEMGNHLENPDSFEIVRKIGTHLEKSRQFCNHPENEKSSGEIRRVSTGNISTVLKLAVIFFKLSGRISICPDSPHRIVTDKQAAGFSVVRAKTFRTRKISR